MTEHPDFETLFEGLLRARAEIASRPFDAATIAHQAVISGRGRRSRWVAWPRFTAMGAILLVSLAFLVAVGLTLVVGALLTRQSQPQPLSVSNGLIAYSTDHVIAGTTDLAGSDVYVVGEGSSPVLVGNRDAGSFRNMCPTFSPDGRRLAYARRSSASSDIVVVDVNASGTITGPRELPVSNAPADVCPRWSSDSQRIGFLSGSDVTMLGLDGRSVAAHAGDPVPADFATNEADPLVSPAGDLVAHEEVVDTSCRLVVSATTPGSSEQHLPFSECGFSLPTWSPDGHRLVVLDDVGGAFSLNTVAIDPPHDFVTIVPRVEVNNERSWPGRGDVSWQPVYR
jgi:hypothetical protein